MRIRLFGLSRSILFTGLSCTLMAAGFADQRVSAEEPLQVYVDFKPMSCPNPIVSSRGGVASIAILGTADFDVNDIDPSTVRIAGLAPRRSSIHDVTAPFISSNCTSAHGGLGCESNDCTDVVCTIDPFCCTLGWDASCAAVAQEFCSECSFCTEEGPDGYDDLVLKFDNKELFAIALDAATSGGGGGEEIELTLDTFELSTTYTNPTGSGFFLDPVVFCQVPNFASWEDAGVGIANGATRTTSLINARGSGFGTVGYRGTPSVLELSCGTDNAFDLDVVYDQFSAPLDLTNMTSFDFTFAAIDETGKQNVSSIVILTDGSGNSASLSTPLSSAVANVKFQLSLSSFAGIGALDRADITKVELQFDTAVNAVDLQLETFGFSGFEPGDEVSNCVGLDVTGTTYGGIHILGRDTLLIRDDLEGENDGESSKGRRK